MVSDPTLHTGASVATVEVLCILVSDEQEMSHASQY